MVIELGSIADKDFVLAAVGKHNASEDPVILQAVGVGSGGFAIARARRIYAGTASPMMGLGRVRKWKKWIITLNFAISI